MHISRLTRLTIPAVLLTAWPRLAHAHLVNANVGEFYAGMLHPVTSPEHLLPLVALALLASQCGNKAGRSTLLLFPLTLMAGILAGSRFPMAGFFHDANLASIIVLGVLLALTHRLTWLVPAWAAGITGLILGWRSGVDWAVSDVGWQFVPGAALTGFIILAVVTAWVPRVSGPGRNFIKTIVGIGFGVAGAAMLGQLMIGDGPAVGRSIGLPTEEGLKALVSVPELSLSFVIGAVFVSMIWGAAHALTPGHGKAIVGAYLVGSRGSAWHAIYLGLTVTITHTLGVFILGLAATLAAAHVQPEKLYPWLGVLSGLLVFILGAVMLVNRIRSYRDHSATHHHHDHADGYDHHHHEHESHHHNEHESHHHPPHPDGEHDPSQHEHLHDHADHHHHTHDDHAHDHHHDHLHHHHGGHSHSHLPPGADGGKVTWRSLLALGVSGGILPCPSAMVLLLTAVALHRIGLGLILVAAFSVGLAGVLTVFGLLFIKGSRLINNVPSFSAASRWLPAFSALVVCLLGGGITLNAVSSIIG